MNEVVVCSVVLGTATTTTTLLDAERRVVIDYEMDWSRGTWNPGSWNLGGPWLRKQKETQGWLAVGSLAG